MDLRKVLKKLGFSENFTSNRRVFSGFSLGVGVSFLVLSVFFLYYSPPFKGFVFQSPLVGSWHFSFSSGREKTHNGKGNVTEGGGFEEKTRCGNLSENGKNASFWGSTAGKGVLERIQYDKNGSLMGLQAGSLHKSSEKGSLVGNLKVKSTERDVNQSFVGYGDMGLDRNGTGKARGRGESVRSGGKEEDMVKGSKEVPSVRGDGNGNFTGETGGFAKRGSESNIAGNVSNSIGREKGHEGNSTEGGKLASSSNESGVGDAIKCDIFDGRWVRDEGKPYYPPGSCPHIDRDFDCYLNGRPDSDFVKWRWQPNHCDIPSLNATDFLEMLRGKKLIFVGDSLNRNMWESLVCILRHSLADKKKVYEISGRKEFKKKGFYAFRYEDYNCTIDFVSSTFLVRELSYKSRNGSVETLRLDLMDRTTSMYQDADIIVFNTGHWWTHEKTSRGENYYQEGNHVYPRLKVMEAYKKALTTWARWIDMNIDAKKTQVYYRGYSVTHFRGGQWNSGGQCDKEIEPIFNDSYLAKYPSKMKVLEHVLAQMSTPVVYMNISKLTDYRKDAHPSIYRKEYKTEEEKIAAESLQDCSHWCLPGIPDTWNELLYASILRYSERLLRH